MIIRLQPDQVPLFWKDVKQWMFISHDVDDIHKQDFSIDILTKILLGDMGLWLGYYLVGEDKHMNYICITTILNNIVTNKNSLYIHTFYPIEDPTLLLLRELYMDLSKYGLANECEVIVFESMDERVCDISNVLGFNCTSKKYTSVIKE